MRQAKNGEGWGGDKRGYKKMRGERTRRGDGDRGESQERGKN